MQYYSGAGQLSVIPMRTIINLTIIATIFSVSCDTGKLVNLPYKKRVVKINVVSYEQTGAKVIKTFDKPNDIEIIYEFLINKK